MAQKSRIETELDPKDLAEFNRLLGTGRLTIDTLVVWLEGQGYEISRSSVGRYAQKFSALRDRMRQSREIVQALSQELGESAVQGQQGRMLVEMARTLVFDMMAKLSEAEGGAVLEPQDVAFLGKGLAELGKALRYDQDFETKVRAIVQKEAAEAASTAVTEAGLSEEVAEAIRKKIFGGD